MQRPSASRSPVARVASRCPPRGGTRRSGRSDTVHGVVTATLGYATTQYISTLRKLLGAQTLRRGDGVIALPESGEPPEGAAAQRVGRTKLPLEMGQGGGAEP